jgi:hypothetical protein
MARIMAVRNDLELRNLMKMGYLTVCFVVISPFLAQRAFLRCQSAGWALWAGIPCTWLDIFFEKIIEFAF